LKRKGNNVEKIEDLLGLTPLIIERREKELKLTIRTIPGIEFLKTMAKRFDIQPWPFVSYLAHHSPSEFRDYLNRYQVYDGAENSQTILEGLREKYIIYSLLEKKMKEKGVVDI
jgi:hypothetical protein